jgi:Secretion system C-terminal sorting domain/PA domain
MLKYTRLFFIWIDKINFSVQQKEKYLEMRTPQYKTLKSVSLHFTNLKFLNKIKKQTIAMKKTLMSLVFLIAMISTAHSQRADSSTLAVFNTARNFTVLSADFGSAITQDLIGEMVMATDAIMVLKEHTQADSSGKKPMRYQLERRADKISSNLKDKIAVIDFNKDYDVTQMCLNVQRAGAKALVIIHESDDKKIYKLLKKGLYKDSIRIPCFTIPNNRGGHIVQLLPSMVGIKLPAISTQNLLQNTILNLDAVAESNKSHLSWVNNTGTVNDYFILQRFNPNTGLFEEVTTVKTKSIDGNEYYTTYDNEPIDGDNIYRIKLVLNDGTIRYSEEKTVSFHAANGIVLYPNPAHDILNINFKGYTGKAVDITIFDMQGKRLLVKHIDKLQTMDYTLDIPENTAVGQHMILIEAQGKRDVVRLFTIGK